MILFYFQDDLECLQPICNLIGELEEIGERLAPLSIIAHDIRFLVVELDNLQSSYEVFLNKTLLFGIKGKLSLL